MWSREARFWTHSMYYHPIPYVGIVFYVSVNLQKICATLWDRTWHFGSCVSHLWDCGRWSPSSTHTGLLTIPQTREQLPGPSKVREAPFLLCVCVWEADRQRDIFIRNCLKIPRHVVDKLATLESWWYSFSLKARRWRYRRSNVLIEFERRKKKKKSVPAWRQLGRRNSLLSA